MQASQIGLKENNVCHFPKAVNVTFDTLSFLSSDNLGGQCAESLWYT